MRLEYINNSHHSACKWTHEASGSHGEVVRHKSVKTIIGKFTDGEKGVRGSWMQEQDRPPKLQPLCELVSRKDQFGCPSVKE